MPVTGLVARELLEAMGGPVGPSTWHPGFAFPLHLGGDVRAHAVLRSKRFFGPIWDVIATMPGTDPSHMVVVGGHRDAWTYGAVDPISGTVDLVQLGRALGKLKASGWKPQRTIVIGSWDGEELNLFGSDEWVEQHAAELRAGCVAYINTDEVAFGPQFGIYATPDLAGALRDATTAVNGPTGAPLAQYWSAQDPKQAVRTSAAAATTSRSSITKTFRARAPDSAARSARITRPTTIPRRSRSSIRATIARPRRRAFTSIGRACAWPTPRIPTCV